MVVSPLGGSMRQALPWMVGLLYQISIAMSTHFTSAHPVSVRCDPATIESVPKRDLALPSSVAPSDVKRLDNMTQPRYGNSGPVRLLFTCVVTERRDTNERYAQLSLPAASLHQLSP
jgi:hypothetical protein